MTGASTRRLVAADVLPLLDLIPAPDLSRNDLRELRARLEAPLPDAPPLPVAPGWAAAPGRGEAPDVPLLIFDPPGRTSKAAVLDIHGGGMVMGTAAIDNCNNAALAIRHGVLIVSVDYRLAPEAPFPAPQEDCYAALAWMVANATALGIDPDRIAVMGASAGGGLAASLALMARDRGELSLCAQLLTYPMLDHRTGSETCPYRNPFTGEFIWTRADNQIGWKALLGGYCLDDARLGWFSPARAETLQDLPPTFIATGALDLFFDEDLSYSQRLAAAGVPVEVHVYPGGFHAFDNMPDARIARQYRADLDRALQSMLGLGA
jgi:triacylglycerol lipase